MRYVFGLVVIWALWTAEGQRAAILDACTTQAAAKHHAKLEDVRFWRDHWRNLK